MRLRGITNLGTFKVLPYHVEILTICMLLATPLKAV
jgi:hypothetical protein